MPASQRAMLVKSCGKRLLMRGDDGIQHLLDGPLVGLGQRCDVMKLLRSWTAARLYRRRTWQACGADPPR